MRSDMFEVIYLDFQGFRCFFNTPQNLPNIIFENKPTRTDVIERIESVTLAGTSPVIALANPKLFTNFTVKEMLSLEATLVTENVVLIEYFPPYEVLNLAKRLEQDFQCNLVEDGSENLKFELETYVDKTVLVTGAGGSIGSQLVLHLLDSGVKRCVCLDASEYSIFNLKQQVQHSDKVSLVVGNYGDKSLLRDIFAANNIDMVFHAGAYKHVSIMQKNVPSAVKNNVLYFINLLEVMLSVYVKDIVLVSTDKAANPSNVMGFTKLLCEQILINAEQLLGGSFNFGIVRFGNVVGSSGSVIPIFADKIRTNHDLRVTSATVTRYLMSITDAVKLILFAGEKRASRTYILKMGSARLIRDIAHEALRELAFEKEPNQRIHYSGLENGEKEHEELFTEDEFKNINESEFFYEIEGRVDLSVPSDVIKSVILGDSGRLIDIARHYE